MAVDGFFGDTANSTTSRRTKVNASSVVCPLCGGKKHKTAKSKLCKFYKGKQTNSDNAKPGNAEPIVSSTDSTNAMEAVITTDEVVLPSATEQLAEMAANDVDNMDCFPFDDEIPNDNLEDEFQDCGTWSEDEDGHIVQAGLL